MDFAAFNERMITNDKIKLYGVEDIILGYEFMLRYPTYRGVWVCNIEKLTVEVDGEPVAQKDMRFSVNGKWFLMNEIKELFREYWFTTAKARIRVMKEGGLSRDGEHTISVHMDHKIPYTGYFGNYLVVHSDSTKTLPVERS
jgi:hypothetical protein